MSFASTTMAQRELLGFPTKQIYDLAEGSVEAISKGMPSIAFKMIDGAFKPGSRQGPQKIVDLLNKFISTGIAPARNAGQINNAIAVISKRYALTMIVSRQDQIRAGGTTSALTPKTYLFIGGGLVVAWFLFR